MYGLQCVGVSLGGQAGLPACEFKVLLLQTVCFSASLDCTKIILSVLRCRCVYADCCCYVVPVLDKSACFGDDLKTSVELLLVEILLIACAFTFAFECGGGQHGHRDSMYVIDDTINEIRSEMMITKEKQKNTGNIR
jgi:hypothetical protein